VAGDVPLGGSVCKTRELFCNVQHRGDHRGIPSSLGHGTKAPEWEAAVRNYRTND